MIHAIPIRIVDKPFARPPALRSAYRERLSALVVRIPHIGGEFKNL